MALGFSIAARCGCECGCGCGCFCCCWAVAACLQHVAVVDDGLLHEKHEPPALCQLQLLLCLLLLLLLHLLAKIYVVSSLGRGHKRSGEEERQWINISPVSLIGCRNKWLNVKRLQLGIPPFSTHSSVESSSFNRSLARDQEQYCGCGVGVVGWIWVHFLVCHRRCAPRPHSLCLPSSAPYSAPYHMLVGAKCAACLLAATWAGLSGPNWLYWVGIWMCAGNGCDGITCKYSHSFQYLLVNSEVTSTHLTTGAVVGRGWRHHSPIGVGIARGSLRNKHCGSAVHVALGVDVGLQQSRSCGGW